MIPISFLLLYIATFSPWLGHSIIINGESGSGKTETARAVLRNLLKPSSTNANASSGQSQQQSALVTRLGHATAVLDALGNARLQRNTNSSRYGKYLELGFDQSLTLAGAYIRTYLLESVLVCKQSAEESNFHVFYLLVKGVCVVSCNCLCVVYYCNRLFDVFEDAACVVLFCLVARKVNHCFSSQQAPRPPKE